MSDDGNTNGMAFERQTAEAFYKKTKGEIESKYFVM